jgi:hypothetical protein
MSVKAIGQSGNQAVGYWLEVAETGMVGGL